MFMAPVARLGPIFLEYTMDAGHFYFLSDQYFLDFTDPYLMTNHETLSGVSHDRPCFYAFKDNSTQLFRMIPFSSQITKYEGYYNNKVLKYGSCDTIVFGDILGRKKAFLIQNMCPITEKYMKNEYIDSKTATPVRIEGTFEKELIEKAKKVLALQRKGIKLIFPDVLKIERQLLSGDK